MRGVRVRGDHATVWQHGQNVGHLYRYILQGMDGRWSVWAQRYLLTGEWRSEACEARFEIEAEGKVQLQIVGEGWFMGDVRPDAELHREEIVMEGTSLTIAS